MDVIETPAEDAFTPIPRYPIESVDNALRLLSLFQANDRIRVKDAAGALGVATGTAHRLLAMLQYRGYIVQDPLTKVYTPGPMLVSIGLQAAQRSDIRGAARPVMERMREEFDETIQLATLQASDVFFIDAVESSKTLKVTSRVGTLKPAHCTSVGKALLADLPRERVIELYPADGALPQCAPSSIGSVSQLLIELDGVRTRGYAVNFGELEDGIGSVAATVRDKRGRAVAAMGIGAPLSRLDDLRITELAEAAMAAAKEIGEAYAG